MSRVRLFAESIKQGVNNPGEVKEDLAALIASVRSRSVDETNDLLAAIKSLLVGNDGALTLLSEVNTLSTTTTADAFGPVIAGSTAAVERLALLVDILATWINFPKKVHDFVESSNTDTKAKILELFNIAKSVSDSLDGFGSGTNRRIWAREVVPRLFQVTLKNSELLLDLTVSATGGELPGEWKLIEDWIKQWWDLWRTKTPDNNGGIDGFFKPLRDDFQPAAIHPLEIRILQKSILGETSEVINSFSNWIIKNIFDKNQRLSNIVPESVFAAGAFILKMVHQDLLDNKNSTKEKVLNIIVENCEQTTDTPLSWQGKRERIHELLNTCPDWYKSSILLELRNRAASRFSNQFNELKTIIPQQNSEIPDEFTPSAELFSSQQLKDFRPSTSVVDAIDTSIDPNTPIAPDSGEFAQFVDSEWRNYLTEIQKADLSLTQAKDNEIKVRGISQTTQQQIVKVQNILESPLAEPAFANSFFGQVFDDMALATYCRQKSSQLFLENTISTSGNQGFESLDTQESWKNIVNQAISDPEGILQAWAKLETWDAWRGRLGKSEDELIEQFNLFKNVAQSLLTALEATNFDALDIQDVRPKLAAITHLGLNPKSNLFTRLHSKLQELLEKDRLSTDDGIDIALKSLLAATYFELGLTAISADYELGSVFPRFLQDNDSQKADLQELAGWVSSAINSSNVWESRVGMNMLILISRLAEETGDLWIEATLRTAAESSRVKELVASSIKAFTNGGTNRLSGLPLALIGFDLLRYSREKARSIGLVEKPKWLTDTQNPLQLIDEIGSRFTSINRQALSGFAAEGSVAGKILLLTILQIKLDELQLQRQLIVKPIDKNSNLVGQVEGLKKTLRSVFCSEEILLRGLSSMSNEEITPWWKTQYWSTLSIQDPNIPIEPLDQPKPDVAFAEELEQQIFSSALKDALNLDLPPEDKLSDNAIAKVQIPQSQWLILGEEESYVIKKETETATTLSVARVKIPFHLFNWSEAYYNNSESTLLSLAATLEASVPIISKQDEKDIDGKFEGEFPELSWKSARERLQKAVAKLEESENKYRKAVETQIGAEKNDNIINLLKQPLLINTADYREQIQVALADLKKSEAELEVAEREALAAEFETFVNELLYEAAEVEVKRQEILEEISELDEEIAEFNRQAEEISQRQASTDEEIAKKNVDLALNLLEQAEVQKRKAERARVAILQEIKLIKKVLGTDPSDPEFQDVQVTVPFPDGSEQQANGQIAAMAINIENSLMSQLKTDLDQAEKDLKVAIDKERERKKKAKRRGWIKKACSFIGAVVGGVLGGPAGVALGAQIGEAVGELTNGIIENKSPEEILVGLIDNGITIAQAAGVNLEQELNTLGAKGAAEIKQFLDQVDSSIGSILDSMPNILDEQLFKDAINILEIEEVPELFDILNNSYDLLKQDLNNLDDLGTNLKNAFIENGKPIRFDSSRDLRERLKNSLYESFPNTTEGIKQIETIAKSIGEEIEDIASNETRQKEILGKIGDLIITQIGQETGEYKRQVISTWIRQKRDLKENWDAVRAEGELLIQELFSDSEVRTEVLSNMELSLLDQEVIQGKIQVLLDPWQKKLDERLKKITEIDQNTPKPNTAVQAAQQRFTYLENCINEFEEKLIPWLKGDDNLERSELFKELNKKLQENADATDNLKIAELRGQAASIEVEQAESFLQKARDELEKAQIFYQTAEIKVSKASLQSKVVNLAKLKSSKVKDAQGNSLKAAEQKYKAAQAKIKAAQFEIQSKQSGLEAATARGAEASKVRAVLSQPPLRLPKLASNDITNTRLRHADALEKAFRAYRELIRYIQAAKANPPEFKPPYLDDNGNNLWSKVFENFNNLDWNASTLTNKETFRATKLGAPSPAPGNFEWELSPEQIQSLFSPEGFRVIVTPQAELEPTIFTVGLDWQIYLDELSKLNDSTLSLSDLDKAEIEAFRSGFNSLWVKEFNKYGISLSENISIEKDGTGWKIIDNEIKPVIISFKPESDTTLTTITDIKEPACYSVKKSNGKLLTTKRNKRLIKDGRSPFDNYYYQPIDRIEAETGRIAALFLVGEIDTGVFLSENDFQIKAEHLGDIYSVDSKNKLIIQLRIKRSLGENRDYFIDASDDLIDKLNSVSILFEQQGDPDPFSIQGIPLSGTTVIRLKPQLTTKFKKITLKVLYSSFS